MPSVVIVDDEPDLLEVMKDFLGMKGIQVVATGRNGHEAIELCEQHKPDFLVLDLSMPEFDGFYALEKFAKLNNPVKVIVITGLLNEQTQFELYKFKPQTTFPKPVNPDKLADFIQNN